MSLKGNAVLAKHNTQDMHLTHQPPIHITTLENLFPKSHFLFLFYYFEIDWGKPPHLIFKDSSIT